MLSRWELHRINIDIIRRSKSSGNTIRSDDTTYLIRLTAIIDNLPIKSESSTMDVKDRQERAGVYIGRFGNGHKLSPDSAGAMFCSHHCRRQSALLNIEKQEHGSTQEGLGIGTSCHQVLRA